MSHVLVTRLDSEGDVLLAGPAIRAVAAGADRVTLLCGPRGRQAAALLPGVDDVRVWRAPWIDPEPEPVTQAAVDALLDDLRALRPDRALIFGSFHQSHSRPRCCCGSRASRGSAPRPSTTPGRCWTSGTASTTTYTRWSAPSR